jgi:hypothetical protein
MTTPTAPTTPTVPVVRPGRSGNVLNLVLILAALIAIGGIAFAVGRTTAPRTTAATGAGAGAGTGNFGGPRGSGGPRASGGPGGFGGGGFGGGAAGIRGTVTAVSPTSITIQVANAGTFTIGIDGSTTYHREVAAGATDVAAGREVIVQLNGRNPNGGPAGASAGPSSFGAGTATDITVVTP